MVLSCTSSVDHNTCCNVSAEVYADWALVVDFFRCFDCGELYFTYLRKMNEMARKYKIGFDAKRLFRNYTGLGNYSRTLVGNLRTMFPEYNYLLFAEKTSENAEAVDFLSERYEVVRPGGWHFLWRLWRINREIKSENIDVYHGLSHDLPFGITHSGAKSVVTIHDVCYKTYPKMFAWTERIIYSIKYRHSLRTADCVVAISESTRRDILHYFAGKIDGLADKTTVVYQALNPVFYERQSDTVASNTARQYGLHGDFLLYVGSINSRKNLMGVIEAIALMPDDKRMMLAVVGGGGSKYAKSCFQRAEELNVSQYIVHIEGVSSMRTLQAFYQSAKMLVYPSFYEGFGLPVTEALLSGCPVITSEVSSLPEAGGDHAFYVDPYSARTIAGAIVQVLDMSDRQRAERCENSRRWAVETFDSDRLTHQIETIYQDLCKTK